MNTEENEVGKIAVEIATKGEHVKISSSNVKIHFSEFGKFVGIWFFTAIVLFGSLMIVTLVSGEDNIVRRTIEKIDTLNMMFSLVLSALLEQIWSKGVNKGALYNFTLGVEGALTILGGMLFMAYSIVKITDPKNQLLQFSYALNMGYIIASTLVVTLGFLSRSIHETFRK